MISPHKVFSYMLYPLYQLIKIGNYLILVTIKIFLYLLDFLILIMCPVFLKYYGINLGLLINVINLIHLQIKLYSFN